MRKQMLLLKAGVTRSRERLGDYEAWFAQASGAEVTKVEVHAGEVPPPAAGFDVIVMSGSPKSVTALEPWMLHAADFLAEAVAAGRPVLGVCFGHQLLAWRFGAKVVKHERGRELGTFEVRRTAAGASDALFSRLPPVFDAQQTHEDHVVEPTAALTVLATNAHSAVQAFRVGDRGYGVQFHPEMSAAATQFVIDDEGGQGRARETPAGVLLLREFVAG